MIEKKSDKPGGGVGGLVSGEEYVRWAYRLLLGREPENPAAIQDNPYKNDRVNLIRAMLVSEEFRSSGVFVDQRIALTNPTADLIDLNTIEDRRLREYALTGYSKIGGWGVNDFLVRVFLSLDQYQKSRSIVGNVFELGVYQGRVFILLALAARASERAVALDVFETLESHNIDKSGFGATRKAFDENVERYGLRDKVDVIVGDSLYIDFAAYPALSSVRFAHIDGAHYVDALVNDLVKTQRVMVPGGIIVVDDYNHNAFTGVNEGVHRFLSFATPRLVVPFAVGSNKVFLTTHSHHAELVTYVRNLLPRPMTRIHGFDVVSLTD